MDIANGRISSAEVLLRLRDEGELVPPSRFVYIAERAGLMPQVDAWVVEHSLAMLARLRRSTTPSSSSRSTCPGHSIGNPDIERTIRESLARHDVDPSALILEITETAAVADVGAGPDVRRADDRARAARSPSTTSAPASAPSTTSSTCSSTT